MSTEDRGHRRLGDRFIVEEELGTGGMGRIHRGRDERLGAPVAIKFLKHGFLEDPVVRERFRREALSLARLRHPGIVTVLDFGEADGVLYMVLELVRGRTLEALRVETGGPLPVPRAFPIVDQILAALEACHAEDIAHRDMKPSNVMVSTEHGVDRVKVIDFGLARATARTLDKLTATGTVQGTPHYMAPEQCRGEEVGAPADIYATGVLLYEMLAGAVPLQGADAATIMAAHLFVAPPPLRELAPGVSAGIAAAVHHALEKRPEDRPTAHALRSALASALAGIDPEAVAEAAAFERRRASGLSRVDRAISQAATVLPSGSESPPPRSILVWMPQNDRSAMLRSCLGTAGFTCSLWTADALPSLTAIDALILSATDLARLRSVRSLASRIPVVVVDVAGPDETTGAIRAGADDMLLRSSPDADIVPKLHRLTRRRRR